MKKILYIHHDGGIGGAPTSLALLIKNLDRTKYYPIVLLISDGPVKELFESCDAEVIFCKKMYPFHGSTVSGMTFKSFIKSIFLYLTTIIRSYEVLKKINYDLLHLNTTCLFAFAQVSKYLNPNVPIICHIREPLLPNFYGCVLRFFNKISVDHFIAITKFDAKTFQKSSKKLAIVYNCSDINGQVKKQNNTKFNCLFLSRVSPENGVDILLKAAAILYEKYPHMEIEFSIYGYPSLGNDYTQQLELLKTPNILFKEITIDIAQALSNADIQISPYRQPHFSRAVIEAGLMGIPSIVSNIGGLSEEVIDGETGFVIQHNNPSELAERIYLLYNDKNLQLKLGNNAKVFAKENFSVQKCQNRIEAIYKSLLLDKD